MITHNKIKANTLLSINKALKIKERKDKLLYLVLKSTSEKEAFNNIINYINFCSKVTLSILSYSFNFKIIDQDVNIEEVCSMLINFGFRAAIVNRSIDDYEINVRI